MNLFQYYHVPWVRALRSRARNWGIVGILRRFTSKSSTHYEEAFQHALKSAIQPGDVIWDIGANVGYYTLQFLEWTGPEGKVVAFEPLPEAFAALKKALGSSAGPDRCLLHQAAITDHDGEVHFTTPPLDAPDVTTVGHILETKESTQDHAQSIIAYRVDSAVNKLGLPLPQATKIDVEGYEEEVLIGGISTFSHPSHRELFIEVHFTRLTERQKDNAPARIVKMLKEWNYHVAWLDASHIWASRTSENKSRL